MMAVDEVGDSAPSLSQITDQNDLAIDGELRPALMHDQGLLEVTMSRILDLFNA